MAEMCGSAERLLRKKSKLLSLLEKILWQNSHYILNGPRILSGFF